MKDAVILIPSYEPDDLLVNVVKELRDNDFPILVVNDGSGPEFEHVFDMVKDQVAYLSYEKNHGKGYAMKHIAQAETDRTWKRDEKKADEGSLAKLTEFMSELLKAEVGKVVTTEKLTTSPVSLTVEGGQMSLHLERLMRNHQQQTAFASTRILELNPYHPLIIKLADMVMDEKNKEKVEEVSRVLLDQAIVAEGETISDPSYYAEKISGYILKDIA